MKKLLFLFFLVICSKADSKPQIDTIKTGIYLKSLYDFNSSAFAYDVDLWMWLIYSNDSLKPLHTIEIANAKNYDYSNLSVEKRGNKIWASQNCKATINQNWDLKSYPFDKQKLEIILEESELDTRKLVLITEKNKFEYNDQININGWKIDSSVIRSGVSYYKSDFGDPSLNGESKYSKVHIPTKVSHHSDKVSQ